MKRENDNLGTPHETPLRQGLHILSFSGNYVRIEYAAIYNMINSKGKFINGICY